MRFLPLHSTPYTRILLTRPCRQNIQIMKQSTSFAQVATNLLNVLQGYTKGIRFLLVMFLTLTVSANVWGEEVTYVFTTKDWAAKIGSTSADWTSGKSGAGFSNNGIQVTTASSGANATSPISFDNISQVVVTYNTNKSAGAGSLDVKIGDNSKISQDWKYSGSGDGRTSNYTATFNLSPVQNGKVTLTANTTTNSIYVVSIKVITADAKKYKIIYDANGGSTTCVDDEYEGGATVNICATSPINLGNSFTGWKRNDNADIVSAGDSFTMPENDVTLTAQWTPLAQYTVTWMVDKEKLSTEDVYEGAKWSSLTLPTAPNPNDYCGQVFAGWTTTNIGSTGLDKDNDATAIQNLNLMTSENKSSKTNTITGDITFYAVFADYAD